MGDRNEARSRGGGKRGVKLDANSNLFKDHSCKIACCLGVKRIKTCEV